jgi:acetolactate synthase small subunit
MMAEAPRTLSVVLHRRPGALDRVVGLLRRHGCSLVSMTFDASDEPNLDTATLRIAGPNAARVPQQLRRLVDVVRAVDVTNPPAARAGQSLPLNAQADGHSSD